MCAVYVLLEVWLSARHTPQRHLPSPGVYGGVAFAGDGNVVLSEGVNHRRAAVQFRALPSCEDGGQVGVGVGGEGEGDAVREVQPDVAFHSQRSVHEVAAAWQCDGAAARCRTAVYECL